MRMHGPLSALLLVVLGVAIAGCEEEVDEEQTGPIVGPLELPISKRHQDPRPTNPLRIEISLDELRLDNRKVLDLSSGRAAESDRRDDRFAKLESAIEGGGAKNTAAVSMHVNAPYETLVALLSSLGEVGVRTVAFEVRKGTGPETGWMALSDVEVREKTDEPVEFDGEAQRQWDEVVKAWEQAYEACVKAHSVDCDPTPMKAAEGGKAELTLLARGKALKASFERFGVEEGADGGAPEEGGGGGGGGGPELIPGVPAPIAPAEGEQEELEIKPETDAAFTWKFAATTEDPSPISLTLRPLCGAKPCGAVVTSEYLTPSMRALTFIGAAFPDGAPGPSLVFFRPQR